MTLTKAHIVEKLFAQNIFTKGECSHIIETALEILKQSLEDGEDALITGFGKLYNVPRKLDREIRWYCHIVTMCGMGHPQVRQP
jgi:integration host factor subunit alpha